MGTHCGSRRRAMDLVYLGVTALFFGLTWALVRLCERL
jgi:hypothetical protein